jgi:hypothetical protein
MTSPGLRQRLQAYGDAKSEGPTALKRKFDPTNFFRLDQNISPG